jgi:hypothetical protein
MSPVDRSPTKSVAARLVAASLAAAATLAILFSCAAADELSYDELIAEVVEWIPADREQSLRSDIPVYARGRVIDESGAPVSQAYVSILRRRRRAPGADFGICPTRHGELSVTDADGAFEIRDAPLNDLDGPFRIAAFHAAHYPSDASVPSRETPIVVRVARGGGLRGRFAAAAAPYARYRFEVVVSGPAVDSLPIKVARNVEELRRRFAAIDEDGGFLIDGLAPGTAVVTVREAGVEGTPIVEAEVEIAAGRIAEDPRLQDVDPPIAGPPLRISVRDEEGKPVPDAIVSELAEAKSSGWDGEAYSRREWRRHSVDRDGVAFVPRRARPLFLTASAPSRGAIGLGRTANDAVVVLPPQIDCVVAFVLPEDLAIPPPPYLLYLSLHWRSTTSDDDETVFDDGLGLVETGFPMAALGEERVAVFKVRTQGTFEVRLWTGRAEGSSRSTSLADRFPVVVGPTDKDLRIELSPDVEKIARSLRDMGRR